MRVITFSKAYIKVGKDRAKISASKYFDITEWSLTKWQTSVFLRLHLPDAVYLKFRIEK
jgi:hypothetical protein